MPGSSQAAKNSRQKTALNLCKITPSRSRASPDRCEILWPSSLIKGYYYYS